MILLTQLLVLPNKQFQLNKTENSWLDSQTLHRIFTSTTEKRDFFEKIVKDTVIPPQNVLVIDCGYSNWLPKQLNKVCASSSTDILEKLKTILAGELFEDHQLDLLVIENISEYYFELRLRKDHNWYYQISDLSHQLVKKYRCNVVLTSWDSGYESGYNSKRTTTDSFVNQWLDVDKVVPEKETADRER